MSETSLKRDSSTELLQMTAPADSSIPIKVLSIDYISFSFCFIFFFLLLLLTITIMGLCSESV